MPLLVLRLGLPIAQAAPERWAVLMAGSDCPDPALAAQIEQQLKGELDRSSEPDPSRSRTAPASRPAQDGRPSNGSAGQQEAVAAALARTRATRALQHARQLYTRTDFSGCIALLSITEQELGLNLADRLSGKQQQAHLLLAQVNLWLGVCQWAVGDPQTAAAAFVRSAQLPGSARPDPALLPPEVISAFQRATAAPRAEVSCTPPAQLGQAQLTVDGAPLVVEQGKARLTAGTHYLALNATCASTDSDCLHLRQRLGHDGLRSMRLEASPESCRLDFVPLAHPSPVSCLSFSEAEDATLVHALVQESGSTGALVLTVRQDKIVLRLLRGGRPLFLRQLVTQLDPGQPLGPVVEVSMELLLNSNAEVARRVESKDRRWYEQWWIWAIAGGTVAAASITAAVLATGQTDHVKVVFGP
jgi:hypothetical protein